MQFQFPRILGGILITALIAAGGVYLFKNSYPQPKTTETAEQAAIQTSSASDVREITPGGYLIADQLFFSPKMGISFMGTLKGLQFENNEFRVKDSPGVIRVFQAKNGEGVMNAMEAIVKGEGKNPDDCDFNTTEINGNGMVNIKPIKPYVPTETELFAARKKELSTLKTLSDYRAYCDQSPECSWDKDKIVGDYNQKHCSKYAVSTGYKDGSFFQFSTEGNGNGTFVYVHDEINSGDASWIHHVDVLAK